MSNQLSETMVLHNFFGKQPGQNLAGFANEVKQLSAAEKLELAQLAAKAMGLTQDKVAFQLS